MLAEIRNNFDSEKVNADLCILYEVTNYQDENADEEFWKHYDDSFKLGKDDDMVGHRKAARKTDEE